MIEYIPGDCIGRKVKQLGFERRGEIRATRKEGGHVVEALVRWGDERDGNYRWELAESVILLPQEEKVPA